ncbi:DUF4188 domain-containing protein [Halorientalis pallida]|uniref:DUF4188 domain-containing protein n=1 Tax=Halorientalis pallida TaxID=2479928 RepID=UPI003C703166
MGVLDRVRRGLAALVGPERRADGGRDEDHVVTEKVQADRDGEFVVFQIGMRINRFWKVHRWLPVALAAPRMVRELQSDPDSGLLGSRTVVGPGLRNIGFVQYWDSFEDLREYAHDAERRHRPAWVDYYQDGTADDSAVGIWHETYVVGEDDHESVYNNVPPHGLGAAEGTDLVPATGDRETATDRLGRHEPRDAGGD